MNESEVRDFFFKALSSYGLKHGKKELSIEGLRIDIFAVDKQHIPYIIEFKKNKNRHIVGQAAQYLSLIPTYKNEVEKALNFYDINWPLLKVLCVAPDFLKRDFTASEYEPLKGKVHFYEYQIIKNSRNQIFSLNINYKGPDESGPLTLPEKVIDEFDIMSVSEEFFKITQKEARREYYSIKILPLLKEICSHLKDFENVDLYPHISYWRNSFEIRLGTDKKKPHKASIALGFNGSIYFGFDLTHSYDEGKLLANRFKEPEKIQSFIEDTLKQKDYFLWIPNTGILCGLPIDELNQKGLKTILSAYDPEKDRDCYIRILKQYDRSTLNVIESLKIFKDQFNRFKYIFDYLK